MDTSKVLSNESIDFSCGARNAKKTFRSKTWSVNRLGDLSEEDKQDSAPPGAELLTSDEWTFALACIGPTKALGEVEPLGRTPVNAFSTSC